MPPIVSKGRPLVVLLSLLCVVCLASDFLMVPVLAMVPAPLRIPGVILFLAIVGCVLAQGCLLAAWLAWSDQPFWQRLVWPPALTARRGGLFGSSCSHWRAPSARLRCCPPVRYSYEHRHSLVESCQPAFMQLRGWYFFGWSFLLLGTEDFFPRHRRP